MSGGGVDKLLPGGVLWAPVVRDMHCMSPPLIGLLYISDPSLLQWIMIFGANPRLPHRILRFLRHSNILEATQIPGRLMQFVSCQVYMFC